MSIVISWLKRLFRRKEEKKTTLEFDHRKFVEDLRKREQEKPPRPIRVRVPRKRPHHDISRFMKKHGRWSKEYRASVKAKVKPED